MSFNITGNKRIIHDCCVDIHNYVKKWNSIVIDAYSDFSKICVNRLQYIDEEAENLDEAKKTEFYEGMEQLCEQLGERMDQLRTFLLKMKKIVIKVKSLQNLTDLSQSISDEKEYIPFQVWPLSKFRSVFEEIEIMFQADFKQKENLFKDLCFLKDRHQLIMFQACWKYQPIIDKRKLNLFLNRIICELNLFSKVS